MKNGMAREWRIGTGYTPGYLVADDSGLSMPDSVTYMELGIAELSRWRKYRPGFNIDLSLHLARTPITEASDIQDRFIERLYELLAKDRENGGDNLNSIGVHLTGPRNVGIGRYGFSSHYIPSESAELSAIRFVEKLKSMTELPIMIENANFYSKSIQEIVSGWKSTERICRVSGAQLIVDLSHMLIDAENNRLDPDVILGVVPWDSVAELHLSGVRKGKDGVLHDGHSLPVYEKVWDLLNKSRALLSGSGCDIVVTIEHSDYSWLSKREEHNADFVRLKQAFEKCVADGVSVDRSEQYAKSYLSKLLKQWIPKLEMACNERSLVFDSLIDDWLNEVIKKQGSRIVLTEEELLLNEGDSVKVAANSFADYARGRIQACDAA